MAQGLDVTQEHRARAALFERERKLRELKTRADQQAAEIAALQTKLDAAVSCEQEARAVPDPSLTLRALAADLADEYGNLLTGVLGHVSLAVAELEDRPAALDDVRAIERAARGAARLTRRLAAVGSSLHRGSPVNLAPLLEECRAATARHRARATPGAMLCHGRERRARDDP